VILPRGPRTQKVLLIALYLGTVTIYVGRVVRVYLAQSLADSSQGESRITGLEHSIRLAPDDAEFPHLLGLRLSASDQDDDRAIANLRKAVTLNPNRGHYWIDLASVYQITGNVEKEQGALQSALNSEPGNPEIAAGAAQFFLESGDTNRAFPLFKQALEQNPDAADTILPVLWRNTQDVNLILTQAIPASPELQLAFLRMLTAANELTAANDAWQYLVAAHRSFQPQLSFFYFDYLLKERDFAGFDRGWHALAGLAPAMQAYLPNDNLIVNASFEQPLLNSGFDWRHEPVDHIAVGIDDRVAHSGSHSLSLSYDGNPAYDAGWIQFVPVQANADYEFSAWIKSSDVTTSSGPRIALVDALSGANLLLTDDVLDTHPWREIKGTLHVPGETELLTVKITRAPANPRIRGQVWIDDLRLVKR
jgi:hypothetical protein